MRILVAGWHGQVALALSEASAAHPGVEAYAVGRPALDLTDRPSIGRTLFGISPDVIINTAAYTDVEGAEHEPDIAYQRNTHGAAALASQAARIGVPIIHLSTVYVFDGEKQSAYNEDDETNPVNAYGRSKRDGETAVAAANPKHIILRTGWIYSPFKRNFVTGIIDRSTTERELKIDDSQRGSPTYAPRLAGAILDIAATITREPQDNHWGTYHIADAGTANWLELASEAVRIRNRNEAAAPAITALNAEEIRHRASRPLNATLDCSKLHATFAIRLPDWRTSVRDCVGRLG